MQQAVDIREKLAIKHPAKVKPDLAVSLQNLADRLSDLGRRPQALEAMQRAVEIRQELAAEQPETFNSDLASSLQKLADRLADLGCLGDALDVIQKAVQIRRMLVNWNASAASQSRPRVIT